MNGDDVREYAACEKTHALGTTHYHRLRERRLSPAPRQELRQALRAALDAEVPAFLDVTMGSAVLDELTDAIVISLPGWWPDQHQTPTRLRS